ncbi:hypothetical protein OC25_24100 [Pedobacter kyungheensis]|uniref:Uncharacterized protein n=1 Tax=Pedobacter kyungheensis TaxID=1069985 RepID=A0A0C1FCS2_9SPHI|nr:hypothetical protein [Pedobacter kyungheensis]KIA90867.1 hypothetical protein OC25_24100 [Pedobacter kyungheensis]
MKSISLIIIAVFSFCSLSSGQENGDKLIRKFLADIYNTKISSEVIISKFVKHEDTVSLRTAALAILDMRSPRDSSTGHFSIMKKDILEHNFSIDNFIAFNSSDQSQFNNLSEVDKKGVYRIKLKNTIPVYVLVKQNKIVSFFGFRKAGSDFYTFIVY